MNKQQIKDLQDRARKVGDDALVSTCKRALQGAKQANDFLSACTLYFTSYYPAV